MKSMIENHLRTSMNTSAYAVTMGFIYLSITLIELYNAWYSKRWARE